MRFTFAPVLGAAILAVVACDGRLVARVDPTITTPISIVTRQQSIDKIDLLFDIDNSASMGDKQEYLKAAIPDLIKRLVQPNVVNGEPEFPPVHNLHIGVVTSSLGPRLGNMCDPNAKTASGLSKHNDDKGHLINRATDDEHALADMQPSSFLAWFPDVPANGGKQAGAGAVPLKDLGVLESDFSDLIAGVHELGCGIESQLESWYRFLVQPDPYDSLDNPGGHATWVGVDKTIIQQRHDFLRPDSLVAVIVLSDENDSEIDVRAFDGNAWKWMDSGFEPPKGTSACNASPADPACTSCLLAPNKGARDPNCQQPYSAANDWGMDVNLRHVHMKQKYGVDLQFPMQRYVNGLSSSSVPNRDGEYPVGKANYVGTNNCTNPLFASQLPDGSDLGFNPQDGALCKLPLGSRTKDLIFYAHIGGVPHELLHVDPTSGENGTLTDGDWEKILGHDPLGYDYTNIDPHMIEADRPRAGLSPPSSADDADPIHGREWVTDGSSSSVDLEYACTFPLAAPRDCSLAENKGICDCPASTGAPHDGVPPVCDGANITRQTKAKAYPTIRETLLARLMGSQGILSSICPMNTTDTASPVYGYRPAIAAIIDRLKVEIGGQCLPEPLVVDDSGHAECLVLEVMPDATSMCDPSRGLSDPPPDILRRFKESIKTDGKPGDPSLNTVCQLTQLSGPELLNGSCAKSTEPGWCYVTGAAAGSCPQTVVFSPSGSPPNGGQISLQCLESVTVFQPGPR